MSLPISVKIVEGFRVELIVEGRRFVSHAYEDKACAFAAVEQQGLLLKLAQAGGGGYASVDDFLTKAVAWFEWEETTGWDVESNAEQIAITLKVKQEALASKQLYEKVQAFVIHDQQGIDIAAAIVKDVKLRWKEIEAKRKEITKPLQAALKSVQALFKEPLDYYASVEGLLKEKIVDAQTRARAAQDAAMQAVQQAHQAGNWQQTSLAMELVQGADITTPAGIQARSSWDFEVVDAAQVPSQFWQINTAALGAFVRETKGTVAIPGVRVFEVQSVAVRA